ncbi:arrestin domain-containing protein 3-like [Magallana gigas]|uniref:arrestin domain-containing protein 3-like n=1 Tax=Magallana gigas TaxID=29159 RepID=UPI0033408F07
MSGIEVTLELKGKNVFLAGERVQGTWFVNVNSAAPVKVNFITTYLIGATYVEWRETNYLRRDYKDDEFKTHELYTRQVTSHPVNGNGKQLAPGYYKYPFDYYIPKDNMHSSFEGHHGATRWFIKIEIGRPMPCSNIVKYKCFTYLTIVDIDLPLYAKSTTKRQERTITHAFGVGDAGSVKLTASIDRSGYCPGECVLITLEAINETKEDLDEPSAALIQEVEFKGNGEERITKACIRKLGGTKLKQIKIPLPCYNEDIKLWFPITIGTVPQNHKKRQNEQPPHPSNDGLNTPDLSNSITYREQRKPKSCFEYSSNTLEFPNILYTPLTTYVVEYTPSTSSLEKS